MRGAVDAWYVNHRRGDVHMKVLVLIFGVLGIASMFVPTEGFTLFRFVNAAGASYLLPVIGGFVLAAAMGAIGLAKPPFQSWQGAVAAAGFAAVFVRLEMWHLVDMIKAPMIGMKLVVVAVLGGLVVSILALAKPEKA